MRAPSNGCVDGLLLENGGKTIWRLRCVEYLVTVKGARERDQVTVHIIERLDQEWVRDV